jgi:hypothetical protein
MPVLNHPTLDQLNALGLHGMSKAFSAMIDNPESSSLGHADWLAMLLDRELVHRQDKRLGARLRYAKLRHQATPDSRNLHARFQALGRDLCLLLRRPSPTPLLARDDLDPA